MSRRLALVAAALAAGLALPLAAQETTVTMSPTSRVVVGTTQLTVTITWCGYPPPENNIAIDTREIKVNGVNVTSSFDLVWDPLACGFTGNVSDEQLFTSTGTITVDNSTGPVTVTANVWNVYSYLWSAMETYQPPALRRAVTVASDGQFVSGFSGVARQARFTIANGGNDADSYSYVVTCSGVATGCTPSSGSVSVAAGGSQSVTVGYTPSGSVGTTGLVRLRATSTADPAVKDSAWTDVTISGTAPGGVVIVGTSPGLNGYYGRELCLTVAVADAAAMECGDLRLVHPLPSVRTLGRVRTPTLIYNSQHARPKPLVQADVTLPTSWGSLPATVTACIYVEPGTVSRGCTSWPGSQWGSLGQTRRVTAAGDDGTWNTGLYGFWLQIYATGGLSLPGVFGELAVVNRQNSPFGGGWWLAGFEEVYGVPDGRRVVVGGDGSVRVYSLVGTNLWVLASPTRPDTLDGNGPNYIRRGPNGVQVVFGWVNGAYRHVSTIDRLGYATLFSYSGSTLTGIQVPTRDGYITYTIGDWLFGIHGNAYSRTVTAPGGRTAAIVASSIGGGYRVDSIYDPDGTRVRFGSGSGASQYVVIGRTDRRANLTQFAYDTLDAVRLWQAIRPLNARTYLKAGEVRGLGQAIPVDSAYAEIDGPRTDVADVTRFWLNGYGAPTRIRNALGQETFIRYSSQWPGLADSVVTPSRLATRAWYNTRGLVTQTTVYAPLGTVGQNATTTYQWHPKWSFVSSVRSPTGLFDTLYYDWETGNRQFQQHGTDAARRVWFGYDATSRLLNGIYEPGLPAQYFFHNPLGNVHRATSALGFASLSYSDAIGRDTLVISPRGTGAQATDSAQVYATGVRQYMRYDAMDRDTQTVTAGPAVTLPNGRGVAADTIRVRSVFDAEGNRLSTTRSYSNNAPNAGPPLFVMTPSEWEYDALNRVSRQHESGQGWTTFTYDPSGNATSTLTARGHTITAQFDALNRLTQRVVPPVGFNTSQCHYEPVLGMSCNYIFPTREAPNLCIGVDTLRYRYDAAGNVTRADNNWAWVRRGYAPNGLLTHDTLFTRTYETEAPNPCGAGDRHPGGLSAAASDFTLRHVYALRATYDLEGRRRELYHPDQLDACSGSCVERYGYNGITGALDTVIGPQGHVTRFTYDDPGRLTTTYHPGATLLLGYDADSRVLTRSGSLTSDNLAYDATNRVTSGSVSMPGLGAANITLGYNGLGALNWALNITGDGGSEDFSTDALGNRTHQRDINLGLYGDRSKAHSFDNAGRLWNTALSTGACTSLPWGQCHPAWYHFGHNASFDVAGNQDATWGHDTQGDASDPIVMLDESRSYYGADDRLMVQNRHLGAGVISAPGGVFEEYRYDALGRRVLVRSRRTNGCAVGFQCGAYTERTVWDGDQVLYEIRAGGADSTAWPILEDDNGIGYGYGEQDWYGRVAYTHAHGIDQPVGLSRYTAGTWTWLAPMANWQGDYAYGVLANGNACPGYPGCPPGSWPGNTTTADGGTIGGPGAPSAWLGNLVANRADGSGLQYLRNRYYDPATGRFTQSDPIGLAGGMNLYGFAGGDPVNFSDPFGLVPIPAIIAAVVVAVEVASAAYDVYETVRAFRRSRSEGAEALQYAIAGGIAPGPGNVWRRGGRAVEAGRGLRGAATWGRAETLADHFARHGADFAARSADEYAGMASDFLRRSQVEGLPTKIDNNGVIRVYDPGTNTFGAFNPDGSTRSFFKPGAGSRYWDVQPGAAPASVR